MNSLKIILILLIIIFYVLFFYFLINLYMNTKNKKIEKPKTDKHKINYLSKNNNYTHKNCVKKCSPKICNKYDIQKKKYNLCKRCKNKNYCYNEYRGICEPCVNKYSCEKLYGYNKISQINPIHNFCIKCS